MSRRRLPSLSAVRAFEAAARHRSMTRGAEELGLTPGAVSRQVRALEIRMDAPLFVRRPTGLELTDAGAALAVELGEALDRIAEAARGVRLRGPRTLSLGAYGFLASRFLLPRMAEIRRLWPELVMELHASTNPLDLTLARYDAVFTVADGAPRPGIVTRRLLPISTIPVRAPAPGAASVDFAKARLLHARSRPEDWRRWLDHAGYRNVSADGGSSFESVGLAIEGAVHGLGVAIGIQSLIGRDVGEGRLVPAHPRSRATRRWFVLQYERGAALSPDFLALGDWLVAEAEECVASSQAAISARIDGG